MKRIQTGNWYNTKIVDFYTYYLNEKLGQKSTHGHTVVLPSLFYQPINAQAQDGDVSLNYQEVIELLIKKAEEIKRGEQNIFRNTDRMFFVANLIKTHWVIIEFQKAPAINNKLSHDYAFESMSILLFKHYC